MVADAVTRASELIYSNKVTDDVDEIECCFIVLSTVDVVLRDGATDETGDVMGNVCIV